METRIAAVARHLRYIEEKYRRMPDTVFLVHEAYIEKGVGGEKQLCIEICPYAEGAAARETIDTKVNREGDSSIIGVSVLESSAGRGKHYICLAGDTISKRARRLRDLITRYRCRPPADPYGDARRRGFEFKACQPITQIPREGAKETSCHRKDSCVFIGGCPRSNGASISGLRFGGRIVAHTKILQITLFKLGYGDEMRFEKYFDDGRFGKRTCLAVSAFIEETNYLEGLKLYPLSGEEVTTLVAAQMADKCSADWERPAYYLLTADRWDLQRRNEIDEMIWLAERYHVRQLQSDMIYFGMTRPSQSFLKGESTIRERALEEIWIPGVFDIYTEEALLRFQRTARAGARWDATARRFVSRAGGPTFTGAINGVLDRATKEELHRWHAFRRPSSPSFRPVENRSAIDDSDQLSIVLPTLACPILCKPGETINLLIASRKLSQKEQTNAEQLTERLKNQLALYFPVDATRPFSDRSCQPPLGRENNFFIVSVSNASEAITTSLYQGTRGVSTAADCVDSPQEQWLEHLGQDAYDAVRKTYDRQYSGLVASLGNSALWQVGLRLVNDLCPGLYHLGLTGTKSGQRAPVRVFPPTQVIYRVAHIADLHVALRYDDLGPYIGDDTGYRNPNDNARKVLRTVNASGPDFVIFSGDLVDCANHHRPYATHDNKSVFNPALHTDANWRLLFTMLTQEPGLRVPFFMAPGNSDYRHNPTALLLARNELNLSIDACECYPFDQEEIEEDGTAEREPWQQQRCLGDTLHADENALQYYYKHFCPVTRWVFRLGKLQFLLVQSGSDSVRWNCDQDATTRQLRLTATWYPPSATGLSPEMVEWIRAQSEQFTEGKTILCMHHPLYGPSGCEIILKHPETPTSFSPSHVPSLDLFRQEQLTHELGISSVGGWGCADRLDRDNWLSASTTRYFASLVPPLPRDWVPRTENEKHYLTDRIAILDDILNQLRNLPHDSQEPCEGSCAQSTPALGGNGKAYAIAAGYCPRALIIELEDTKSRLIELAEKRIDEGTLLKGMDGLEQLISDGKIRMILCGHLHRVIEIKGTQQDDSYRLRLANYSLRPDCPDYWDQRNDSYQLCTPPAGGIGFFYEVNRAKKGWRRVPANASYHEIRFGEDGRLLGFSIEEC